MDDKLVKDKIRLIRLFKNKKLIFFFRKERERKMCSINHDLKAIFIHIPKTAGTYLADVLHKNYGFKKYYITRPDHAQFCRSYDNSIKSHENHVHGTLMYYKTSAYCNRIMGMTREKWDEYYKFCFVRNPYDKIVSGWNYVNRSNVVFGRYIEKPMKKNSWDYWHVFMPQARHIINERGKIGVDFVGRYENLEDDFGHILNHLKLEKTHISSKKNSRKHLPYFLYYNQSILDKVNQLLNEDFTILKDYYQPSNTIQSLHNSSIQSSSTSTEETENGDSTSLTSP